VSPVAPARCLRCGLQFQGSGIRIDGDVQDLTLGPNTETCPRCGGRAQIVEGVFNVQAGGFEMVSGPDWSWDLIENLRLGLRRIVDEEPADPVRELAKVDATFAKDVKQATRGLTRRQKLAVMGALWGALNTDYSTIEANVEAVLKVLQYVASHGSVPPL
jgi:hypothetical protein